MTSSTASLTSPAAADEAVDRARGEIEKRTRVLIVVFQGHNQADGGVESLTQLIENFGSRAKITVLSQAETPKNQRWRAAGCTVRLWPLPYSPGGPSEHGWLRTLRRIFTHLVWNARCAWLAVSRQIDVAHVNDPHAFWHVAVGLRAVGRPIIYNIRDTKPHLTVRDVFKWRVAFGLSVGQIVLSQEMGRYWRAALGIRRPAIFPVYSIIDFNRMRPLDQPERAARRKILGLPTGFVAGYVASFSLKKAQLAFIEQAGPELQRRAPFARIYFLGDFRPETDPYARACKAAVERLGLGAQMIFQGYTKAVDQWYPALDAVVIATRNEGLARCMIESLASGTPVVSFDVCSAREILEDGDCGRVVGQGDYTGLVTALIRYAAADGESARHSERAAARARALFRAEKNAPLYLAAYQGWSGASIVV